MRRIIVFMGILFVSLGIARTTSAQTAPTLTVESQEAVPGESVAVPVEVTDFTGIGSISLIITYDPEVLSFPEGAETDTLIAEAPRDDFTANVPEPGELRISWFDASGSNPIDLGEGTLLELTFSQYEGGVSPVAFDEESEVTDVEATPLGATYEDGEVQNAADQIQTSVRRTFDAPSDPTSYELVALPGQAGVDVAETLAGRQGTGWRAFREVGATSSGDAGLEAYDEGEAFAFQAGRGFWVISQADWSFEGTVPTVVSGDGTPSIPLHDGWNVVSNPLQADLSWSSVQTASGLQEALWRWNGEWEDVQTFASATDGEAFYVFNGAGLDSLDLPTGTASARGTDRAEDRALRPSVGARAPQGPRGPHWSSGRPARPAGKNSSSGAKDPQPRTLTLRALVDGEEASRVTVGLSADADEAQTYRAPPGHFSAATLHAIGGDRETTLARQVVPATGGAHTFRLQLKGTAGETVTLTTDGLSSWDDGAVTLANERSGATYDLHEQKTVGVSLPEGESEEVPLRLHVKGPPSEQN